MAKASSQKFIARNRAPRVQIEYDVEVYGAQKKIELPFVMGVMADLSGKPADPLPRIDERKFLEIDIDNFDDRLKAALDALGEAPGVTVAADTALAAARKALSLLSLGLIAAGVKRGA